MGLAAVLKTGGRFMGEAFAHGISCLEPAARLGSATPPAPSILQTPPETSVSWSSKFMGPFKNLCAEVFPAQPLLCLGSRILRATSGAATLLLAYTDTQDNDCKLLKELRISKQAPELGTRIPCGTELQACERGGKMAPRLHMQGSRGRLRRL